MGRRSTAVLALSAIAVVLLVASPSSASSAQEQDFVARINAERSNYGAGSVSVKDDLTQVARDWSAQMASEGGIRHDPNIEGKISGWTMLGDNVGRGPSVAAIHDAFMDSPTHRSIILDSDYNQVGVGVVSSGGYLYVTEIFVRRTASKTPLSTVHHTVKHHTAKSTPAEPATTMVAALTGRIWKVDLTAAPQTIDMLEELVALDAPSR
jgi:cysteine-rich secretory family protein